MSTKTTYIDASRKRAVREFLFSFFNEDGIVGLAGPDIYEYIRWCKEKKITNQSLSIRMVAKAVHYRSDGS